MIPVTRFSSMPMTRGDEQCSRCDLNLARSNKHPDRLCGACQHDLRTFRSRPASPERDAWIAAGKPRIERAGEQASPQAPQPSRDPREWPTLLLVEATRELIRRRRAAVDALAGAIRDGSRSGSSPEI